MNYSNIPYLRLALTLLAIILAGTVGYIVLEQWAWWDALYMTIITLSTVGFREVDTLSFQGRVFTALLILAGVGGFTFVFSTIMHGMVAGHISGAWQSAKLKRRIRKMTGHFIVCGYGRVGAKVVERLSAQHHDIVVVDWEPDIATELAGDHVHFMQGDGTREEILRAAGIEQAIGFVCCLPHDADNLFAVLTARTMNSDIHIITRVENESTEAKMRFAGANDVVNPTSIAGRAMAMRMIEPEVIQVIEMLTTTGLQGSVLESVQVPSTSALVGQTVREVGFRRRLGLRVMQVLREDQTLESDVNAETEIRSNDILLVLGKRESVTKFHDQIQA